MFLKTKSHLHPLGKIVYSFVHFLFYLVLFFAHPAFSQNNIFPKNYFISPINPGKPNFLNGNFGEIRPDHFHAGIDFRTNMQTDMPVHAPADGYISEVRVMEKGYGNVIFMKHPNGMMTVYGHLEKFYKPLADFVRKKQYEKKSFTIELNFDSTKQFQVKKGDIIGIAGNTGSSFGPHLHFEIRDSKNNLLNPLKFDFPELTDKIPPFFQSVGLRPLEVNSRVQNEFGFVEFYPQKLPNGNYLIKNPIPVYGTFGLEVLAFDKSEDSYGRNGVTCIEVRIDGEEVYSHHLDSFPYELSRHSNVHEDFELERTKGLRYQRCFLMDGNELNIYQTNENRGKITITDNKTHEVEISLFDSYQNASRLKFTLQGTAPKLPSVILPVGISPTTLSYSLAENSMILKSKSQGNRDATFYFSSKEEVLKPAYFKNYEAIYLWDLRKGSPDSIKVNNKILSFPIKKVIYPKSVSTYFQDSVLVSFNEKSLFDTLYLEVEKRKNNFLIGRTTTPLQMDFTAEITPSYVKDKQRTGVYLISNRNLIYVKSKWKNENLAFSSRYFGTFTVATDTTAPVAKLRARPTKDLIACTISDNMSGIASYSATLNGEWLLMNYDPKSAKLLSERLDNSKPLKGDFRLEVKDNAGNATVLEVKIL